ncbi:MAG: DUF4432 family protein [Clostridia bacterium]|jgi:galactose mutarotase-like enzyme|nr:DUF4432 family protein [Clostridia bacterium]MBT7123512.1 DUF4432 family protein [Clostridia bacterium]
MDYASDRVSGCRIYQYQHRGLTHLCLENELIRVTVIPDKGSDITEITYKPKDINFMWRAPGGGVRETGKLIPTKQSVLGNNLDYYEGGWHESFPGGGPYKDGGMEQGLHGEACLLSWQFCVIKDTEQEISVKLWCETIRFPAKLEKTIMLKSGRADIYFDEELINLSEEKLEYMWGHHPVFGKPFLSENCKIDIDADEFTTAQGFGSPTTYFEEGYTAKWPSGVAKAGQSVDLSLMPKKGEKNAELIFINGLKEGALKITNTDLNLSFSLKWDKELFKCIWYWRVCNGLPGYPWYGRTYNIGLEFWTGYPNYAGAQENGTVKTLEPSGRVRTRFEVNIAGN